MFSFHVPNPANTFDAEDMTGPNRGQIGPLCSVVEGFTSKRRSLSTKGAGGPDDPLIGRWGAVVPLRVEHT